MILSRFRNTFVMVTAVMLLFAACKSQPEKDEPTQEIVRNEACMSACKEKKCAAYSACYEDCEGKGMSPAINACRNQCDIKFQYCNDACASECDARHPVSDR